MANQETPKKEPELVLRGVQRNDQGEYDTTVLLFKGNGDYLQGFVVANGRKMQVIAHMNERKADPDTGEVKPNFLKLVEARGRGDEVSWHEVGYGNAMNRRNDGKPVYFDTVLFQIGDETLNARVGAKVSNDLHRQLGFAQPRAARPRNAAADNAEEPAPAQQAAAKVRPPRQRKAA